MKNNCLQKKAQSSQENFSNTLRLSQNLSGQNRSGNFIYYFILFLIIALLINVMTNKQTK